jgi:DNA repair protein RadC
MSDRESPSADPPLSPDEAPTTRLQPPDRAAELLARLLNSTPGAAATTLDSAGGLRSFTGASDGELVALGLTRRKAGLLRDAFELARLAVGTRPTVGTRLSCGSDVWTHLRARLSGLPVEEFWAIALDVRHRVLFDRMLARGSLTGVEVHPRDVFRELIRAGAAAAIFAHNHPSGDPTPSRADIELTTRLREVGELCGVAVLDHVVVGSEGYVSLAARGWR